MDRWIEGSEVDSPKLTLLNPHGMFVIDILCL